MENSGRREFIKKFLSLAVASPIISYPEIAAASTKKSKIHYTFPDKPFQTIYKKGVKKGGKLVIIGGIHGNEPGAYKAVDILTEISLVQGEILLIPRSNFTSILAFKRGYNGDMNRKFAYIQEKDPDFPYVKKIQEIIESFKPDAVLSLHDGYGFHITNKNAWGQCIVIDEKIYNNFHLYKTANKVTNHVNRFVNRENWKFPVFSTETFHPDTNHKEQQKSLTYFCLSKCNVPAFCLEVSKQLPSLKEKVQFHLLMMEKLFELFSIQITPPFNSIYNDFLEKFRRKAKAEVVVNINGRSVLISGRKTLKIPRGSEVKFIDFKGKSGTFGVAEGVNLNWRSFHMGKTLKVKIKDDFQSLFSIYFQPV